MNRTATTYVTPITHTTKDGLASTSAVIKEQWQIAHTFTEAEYTTATDSYYYSDDYYNQTTTPSTDINIEENQNDPVEGWSVIPHF